MKSRVYLQYGLLGLGGILILFLILFFSTSWWWYWNWLIAASVITFFLYGLDKLQAKRHGGRTPNLILHLLALIGGYPGAFIGRAVFKHKSNFRQNPQFLIMIILGLIISILFIGWRAYSTLNLGA